MIVEDEPAIARGLSLMISRNYPDFQVIGTAGNGKEGVQKILALTPDLIFADINMPVMNGLDMIRQVQEAGFFTRCVILTGYAEGKRTRRNCGFCRQNICSAACTTALGHRI